MSVIFDDLGIDYSEMMTDPENFWEQVVTAAESLKTVLKADNSVENYIKNKIETDEEYDFDSLTGTLSGLYEFADESIPVGALHEFANKLRKLAKDIDHLARDKAMVEIATDSSMDKAVAFDLYKDLREKSNQWADAMTIMAQFNPEEFTFIPEKLPTMPGNYGGNILLTHYVFVFTGEEDKDGIPYRMPQSVIRKLEKSGHNLPELNSLMDLVDYLNAHPELGVSVAQVNK